MLQETSLQETWKYWFFGHKHLEQKGSDLKHLEQHVTS